MTYNSDMKNTQIDNVPLITKRLTEIIETKRISKAELARIAGVSRQSVNGWFMRGSISKEAATKIAASVGVSLAWLLGEESEGKESLTQDEQRLLDLYRKFSKSDQENMIAAFDMRLREITNFYDKYVLKK